MTTRKQTGSNRSPAHPLPMTLRLPATGAGAEEASTSALVDELTQRAAELLEDLGVAGKPEITISHVPNSALIHTDFYDLDVDGLSCRVDLSLPLDHTPAALAAHAAETLYRNRTLVANHALPRLQDHGQRSPARGSLPPGRRRDLLQRALALGLGLPAVRNVAAALRKAGWSDANWSSRVDSLLTLYFSRAISVELGRAQYDAVLASPAAGGEQTTVDEMVQMMRDGLFYELGIRFPIVRFIFSDALRPSELRVRFNRVRAPVRVGLDSHELLVNDTPDRLSLLNVKSRPAINPANGLRCAIIAAVDGAACERAGLTTWNPAGYVILSLAAELRRHAAEYFSSAQSETTLRRLDQAFPMLGFNILERFAFHDVSSVLRALLREQVSIRDLRSILEALLEIGGTLDVDFAKDIVLVARDAHPLFSGSPAERRVTPDQLAETVRVALKRQITHQHTKGGSTLLAYLLSPEIESRVVSTDTRSLAKDERRRLLQAIRDAVDSSAPGASPVVLTTVPVRRRFRALIALEYPQLRVLSYNELSPEVNIQPIKRIGLD